MKSIEMENTNGASSIESPATVASIIPIRDSRNMFLSSLSILESMRHPFGRNQIFNTVPHSYITPYLSDTDDNE